MKEKKEYFNRRCRRLTQIPMAQVKNNKKLSSRGKILFPAKAQRRRAKIKEKELGKGMLLRPEATMRFNIFYAGLGRSK